MSPMNTYVSLGAAAVGPGGTLGEIHRMIVDPQSDCVTDLVVRYGTLVSHERAVPLGYVRGVDEAGVHLALDHPGLDGMPPFVETRYAVPDSADAVAGSAGVPDRGAYLVDSGAMPGPAYGGRLAATTPAPLTEAVAASTRATDTQRPVVAKGLAVLDDSGTHIGDVSEYGVTPDTGRLVHLAIRQGTLLKHEIAVPVDWVDAVAARGILLRVAKDRLT